MTVKLGISQFMNASWLDQEAVIHVLRETDLGLHEDLEPKQIKNFLNELITQSVGVQVDALRNKKELKQAAAHLKAVIEYRDFAAAWSHAGRVVTPIPSEVMDGIRAHYRSIENDLADRPNSVRRRMGIWVGYFFPRALGFYAAAYNRTPKAIPPRDVTLVHGGIGISPPDPAVRFVATLLREATLGQIRLGYRDFFEAAGLGDPTWPIWELETVASRMTEHLRARSSYAPGHLLWEGAREEYLLRFNMLKNNR